MSEIETIRIREETDKARRGGNEGRSFTANLNGHACEEM